MNGILAVFYILQIVTPTREHKAFSNCFGWPNRTWLNCEQPFQTFCSSNHFRSMALSQKKGGKERKKKRQGLTFLTLINYFNWKMSVITTFPVIRGSVVYPFFYEIDHFIFCHIEFVSIWWLSCLERHALFRSAYYTALSHCFQAPPKGTHVLICKLHMEIKWKVRTYLFCSCTKIKSTGI